MKKTLVYTYSNPASTLERRFTLEVLDTGGETTLCTRNKRRD